MTELNNAVRDLVTANLPKAPLRSRLVWALIILLVAVAARALHLWGVLPPALGAAVNNAWNSEWLATLIVAVAGGGLAVEVRGRQSARRGRLPRPRSGRGQRGSITLPALAVVAAVAAALLVSGCTPTWPAVCRRDGARLVCPAQRCQVTADGRRPGGVLGVECDGWRLPVEVEARELALPTCVTRAAP